MFDLLSLAQQHGSLWMLLGALILGYALGSIPFGILLTKLTGGPDLRTIGSGNIGATNVLRTGNKGLAAATLLGDAFKGTLAVLVARFYGGEASALVAMLGALLGHMFPVWLVFKGGKGVATYLGAIMALDWRVGLVFIAAWLASAFIMRFSSLAALVATLCVPIAFWFLGNPIRAEFTFMLSALIWWLHRPNIVRLLSGQETRIGEKSLISEQK
jgi:acyl phosphate:glycerol-3-phosphate acyltransferase